MSTTNPKWTGMVVYKTWGNWNNTAEGREIEGWGMKRERVPFV
jgi:hypothetical protein